MEKQVKEPYFAVRIFNMVLGIAILALIIMRVFAKGNAPVYEMLIFLLAGIENFIGATVSFSRQRKIRGNVYAVICTIFLLMALFLALRYFVFV